MKSIKVKGINKSYEVEINNFEGDYMNEGQIAIRMRCIDGSQMGLLISKANWEKLKKL